jgi:hypothetical protein
MTALTSGEIVAALGPIDDLAVGEILDTGASAEEFARARSWLVNDEAPINAGEPLASGRVARLIEILEAVDEALLPEDAPTAAAAGPAAPQGSD